MARSLEGDFFLSRVARPLRYVVAGAPVQRSAPRRALEAVIHLRERAQDEPVPFSLAEVSATGVFVASDLLLPLGTDLLVDFELPGCAVPVTATGTVVRVAERGRPGMGIRLERVSPATRDRLELFTAGA